MARWRCGVAPPSLFTILRSSGVDEERKRHDAVDEQLQAAQATWFRKRTECLDFINGELRRQGHADPKKVAAGCAGAAARKAKQERLLEQLWRAKESFRPPACRHNDNSSNQREDVNALYHSAVVSGLAMGYARLGKMVMGGCPPPSLFMILRNSGVDEERKRHDAAVEQLQAAQATWSQKRTECLDFINGELCRQGNAIQTFRNVDAAMQEYAQVTGHNLDPLGPKPQLSNFYNPSDARKTVIRHPGDGHDRPGGLQTR